MRRTLIKNVKTGKVKISGFVENVRNLKRMIFIIMKDGTGSIQLTIEKSQFTIEELEQLNALTQGSTLTAEGLVNNTTFVKNGGREILVSNIHIETVAKPYPIGQTAAKEQRENWRFIDLRSKKNQVLFKAESIIQGAFMEYMQNSDYTVTNSPKLLATPSESGAELFELNYFDRKAYLAQSCQFYKQMALQSGFEKYGEIGPAFRADNSNTSRHQTEFVVVDAEIAWPESLATVMNEQKDMILHAFSKLLENGEICKEIETEFSIILKMPVFHEITFAKAKAMLKDLGIFSEAKDFSPEEERELCRICLERYGSEFVFVTQYPIAVRPFYHRWNIEGGFTESYDLLYNGREITTGAIREHRASILRNQIRIKAEESNNPKLEASLTDYIQFFEYGAVPHGGFGMGFARFVQSMFNLNNIDEAVLLPRTPSRLAP